MRSRKTEKIIREGRYVAMVEIESLEDDHAWSPCYSLDDTMKMERVRKAMKDGDLKAAAREAKVFELVPVGG